MMQDMLNGPETIATGQDDTFATRRRTMAIILCVAGFALSVVFGQLHRDGILHFDDLTHYLYSKWAWTWPAYLVNDWGRPGFTALYFLPAGVGWWSCRVLSAALTASTAYMAWCISARLGLRHAWGAVIFTFAQPLLFQLSQTTLTETALAFYLTLATLLAMMRRWTLSSFLLSLAFVTRHEAVVFLPVWIFFSHRNKSPLRRLWPLVLAPLLVNVCAAAAGSKPVIEQFFHPAGTGQYGRGGWLTFFCRSMEAYGPGIGVLALIGLTRVIRAGGGIVAASIAIYFGAQTAVRALGLYDTGGYARFLVGVSPLVAVAALAGWLRLFDPAPAARRKSLLLAAMAMGFLWLSMERQLALQARGDSLTAEVPKLDIAVRAIRYSTLAVAMVALIAIAIEGADRSVQWTRALMPLTISALIVMAAYALCHPLRPPPEAALITKTRAELNARGYGDRAIISACVWIDYVTGRSFPPWRPTVRQELADAPSGSLFAWERQFASSADHGLALNDFVGSPDWRLILTSEPLPYEHSPYLYVFEKTAAPKGD